MKPTANHKKYEAETVMFRKHQNQKNDRHAGKAMAMPWLLILLSAFVFSFSSCAAPAANQPTTRNASTTNVASNSTVNPPTPYGRNFSENPDFNADGWLAERVKDKTLHAALFASLEPGRTLARHNIDKPFNPASVVKLATTLVALKKLGADHRFKFSVFVDGIIDAKGTINGDVYFAGGAPTFNDTSAEFIEAELKKRGIKGVSGKLYVSKDFSVNFNESPERSAGLLADRLKLNPKPQTAIAEQPKGTELFVFESHPLRDVLLYLNTHSNNFLAHKLGDAVGGVEVIRQFLISEVGLPPAEFKLETASGLEENSMTARGIFIVLQKLEEELKRQNLKPPDILPLASENNSTVGAVLKESKFERSVVGKTGTLSAADGGIGMASLAGFIYTKNDGVFIFVLMNQGEEVSQNKSLQDQLLGAVLGNLVDPLNLEIGDSRELLPKSNLSIKDRNSLPQPAK